MTSILEFRDEIAAQGVVPKWLRGWVGIRFLYAIGLHIDLLRETLIRGVKARFPGFHTGATAILCRDRKVLRGPEETEDQICARLRNWRQAARIKGNPVAVLEQLQAYLTPHTPRIRLVNNAGSWLEISTTGAITTGDGTWNWDGNTELSSRFWVLIWVPSSLWVSDGFYGDPGLWGDGGVYGSTALQAVVAGVQFLVGEESCENSRPMHTVLIWDDALWEMQQPNGTWNVQSNRNPNANYWPWQG
jgi:hypothetical protein